MTAVIAPDTPLRSSATGQEPAVAVSGLCFAYRSRGGDRAPTAPSSRRRGVHSIAVHDLTLSLMPGQMTSLLGPNGCGKSTLLRLICGFFEPQAGDLRIFGHSSPARNPNARREIGVVFQSPSLDSRMTVRENLHDEAVWRGIDRSQIRDRVESDLRQAGLLDRADQRVRTLSGGLQRRVDLCRALLHRPRLLLLDEPTTGLDPSSRRQFLNRLHELQREEQLTILIATHLVDEADECDRVILMHRGVLVADDEPKALRRRLGRRQLTAWADSKPDDEILRNDSGHGPVWENSIAAAKDCWRAALNDDPVHISQIARRLIERNIPFTIAEPTLADVFESVTGSSMDGGGRDEPAGDGSNRTEKNQP